MTGMELLALTSAVKGGVKGVKGLYDWATGGNTSEESAYIKYLKNQMNQPMFSQDDINRSIMTGNQQASSTFGRGVADAQGNLTMQGLDNSVVATQVPIKAQQELADKQNMNATSIVMNADQMNKEKKRRDNLNYLEAKTKLAEVRRARRNQGFNDFVDGATDIFTSLGDFKAGSELLTDGSTDVKDVRSLYSLSKKDKRNKEGKSY